MPSLKEKHTNISHYPKGKPTLLYKEKTLQKQNQQTHKFARAFIKSIETVVSECHYN